MARSGWTLDEALAFIRDLLPHTLKAGYHVGLTGSVLIRGESKKDLDLIVYPMNSTSVDPEGLREILTRDVGLVRTCDVAGVHKIWRDFGSNDVKDVEVWRTADRRRIDFFFLK